MLHALSQFGHFDPARFSVTPCDVPTYWYEGVCPYTQKLLRLPRTALAEAIAQGLIHQLSHDYPLQIEGKMYGILLVETPERELRVLKAFSGASAGWLDGLLADEPTLAGWVPPISGRDRVAWAEAQTLAELDAIRQELLNFQPSDLHQGYHNLVQTLETQRQALVAVHAQRKQQRQQQRHLCQETLTGTDLENALAQLNQASQQDGIERKCQKRDRDRQLQPLKQQIDQAERHIHSLKQRRKRLSQGLQAQMHATYSLTNFAGESRSLQQVIGDRMPTGSGECCAPKLLHYAATHQLKPLALAEFWWGPPTSKGDRVPGEFYGACAERCQPLMGFLLSGMSGVDRDRSPNSHPSTGNHPPGHRPAGDGPPGNQADDVAILYADDWLIAVNKPPGLLSVPGRTRDRQDSVLIRLQRKFPNGGAIAPVHRLDQDTSGILLFARNVQSHRHLSQQFQQRQIHKVYEAVLAGSGIAAQGVIDLPLWGDPQNRPYQTVDWLRGKPSVTQFRVIAPTPSGTRIEFIPLTGRTHQLRVHAANSQGLGVPILGDRLYGGPLAAQRLHLHAQHLHLCHPQSGQLLQLYAATPF
jgi:tRNA pseudouridine32 synthase / 23S rRNA pseudouridine746 synthase